jgi:DNA-binding protein HU-beta
MNRRELIRAVAAQTADDVKDVEQLVTGLTDVITAVVARGEAVTIQGFAKFAKVERAARMGRNPRTGEAIRIKASKRVRVSPMKAFKDTVMSPNQAPRLASGVYPTSPELLARQAAGRRAATAAAKSPATKKAAGKKAAGKKATTKRVAAKRTVKKAARATARPTTKRAGVAKRAGAAKRAGVAKRTVKRTAKRTVAKRAAKRTARR